MQMHDILQQDPEIWRLFTCAEEYGETFRDGYDRFPYYMSSRREAFEPRASQYLDKRVSTERAMSFRLIDEHENQGGCSIRIFSASARIVAWL